MNKKVCVIGAGQWGQNHIRTLHEMGSLGGIVEKNTIETDKLELKYGVKVFTSISDVIDKGFDGYVVATPAETHYTIGKTLLENGCNVLIEKPMTLLSEESLALCKIAEEKKSTFMVGHLLLFHNAIKKIKEVVDNGIIGKVYYLYSARLNFGTVRTRENAFWSFAPHDISVIDYIVGEPCIDIKANGSCFLQVNIEDTVIAHLTYRDNIKAHIFTSWLHPFKKQMLVIVGSEGMLSFDDSSLNKEILFYKKRIEWNDGLPNKLDEACEIIPYEPCSPLKNELGYFIENLGKRPGIADGRSGYEVVRILEKVDTELKAII